MPTDAEANLKPEIAHILSTDVVGYPKLFLNEKAGGHNRQPGEKA